MSCLWISFNETLLSQNFLMFSKALFASVCNLIQRDHGENSAAQKGTLLSHGFTTGVVFTSVTVNVGGAFWQCLIVRI